MPRTKDHWCLLFCFTKFSLSNFPAEAAWLLCCPVQGQGGQAGGGCSEEYPGHGDTESCVKK